jgi:hypothetical protein
VDGRNEVVQLQQRLHLFDRNGPGLRKTQWELAFVSGRGVSEILPILMERPADGGWVFPTNAATLRRTECRSTYTK